LKPAAYRLDSNGYDYEPDNRIHLSAGQLKIMFDCTLNGNIVKPDFWDEK